MCVVWYSLGPRSLPPLCELRGCLASPPERKCSRSKDCNNSFTNETFKIHFPCRGLHFLAVQEDEEAEGCAGLWLLLDRKPPAV